MHSASRVWLNFGGGIATISRACAPLPQCGTATDYCNVIERLHGTIVAAVDRRNRSRR